MKKIQIRTSFKAILADTITPVSIYLKIRDIYPNSILLESSDYHGSRGSHSYICMNPVAEFIVQNQIISISYPGMKIQKIAITRQNQVIEKLNEFIENFETSGNEKAINGIFGYSGYDSITYFEDLTLHAIHDPAKEIPVMRYCVYQYLIDVNHFQNTLTLLENQFDGMTGDIDRIYNLLYNRNISTYPFEPVGEGRI